MSLRLLLNLLGLALEITGIALIVRAGRRDRPRAFESSMGLGLILLLAGFALHVAANPSLIVWESPRPR